MNWHGPHVLLGVWHHIIVVDRRAPAVDLVAAGEAGLEGGRVRVGMHVDLGKRLGVCCPHRRLRARLRQDLGVVRQRRLLKLHHLLLLLLLASALALLLLAVLALVVVAVRLVVAVRVLAVVAVLAAVVVVAAIWPVHVVVLVVRRLVVVRVAVAMRVRVLVGARHRRRRVVASSARRLM